MSCEDILPSVAVTPIGEGYCRIDSHHLAGVVVDEAGIVQTAPAGLDPDLAGLQVRECVRNPAVDYYRVDLRTPEGHWLPLHAADIRALSGEIAGTTPPPSPRRGRRATVDPVTLNAQADGASLCLNASQQEPIRQSLERLVGPLYGQSSYCRSLFRSSAESSCAILVPALQRLYNAHPERNRDGLKAPQSLVEEHSGTLWGSLISLLGAWLGLEGVAYMFGHRVHQWSARYAARQAAQTAVSRAGGPTAHRSILGRLIGGAANLLTRIGGFLTTPILVIDPCPPSDDSGSAGEPFCVGRHRGPTA